MSSELVPIDRTVELLLRTGMSPKDVASELGIKRQRVDLIFYEHKEFLDPEDKILAASARELINKAIRKAEFLMDYGSPAEQYGIVKVLVSRAAGMAGAESESHYDLMRNELEELLHGDKASTEFGEPIIEVDDSD